MCFPNTSNTLNLLININLLSATYFLKAQYCLLMLKLSLNPNQKLSFTCTGEFLVVKCCFRMQDELPELLSECDYVCSILPSTAATDGFLDGNVLSHCRHKVFASIPLHASVENDDSCIIIIVSVSCYMPTMAALLTCDE